MYRVQMREPTFYVLSSLLEGPLHGYGIARRAETLSGGSVLLAAGTLYGALDRLVAQQQIAVEGEETVNGRRRRYYKITDVGRSAVYVELERMRSAVAAIDAVGAFTGLAPVL